MTTYGRFPANELLTLQLDTGIGRCGGVTFFFLGTPISSIVWILFSWGIVARYWMLSYNLIFRPVDYINNFAIVEYLPVTYWAFLQFINEKSLKHSVVCLAAAYWPIDGVCLMKPVYGWSSMRRFVKIARGTRRPSVDFWSSIGVCLPTFKKILIV